MSFLLDTNTCSAFLKNPRALFSAFVQHLGNLATTTIVLAELFAWAYRRDDPRPLIGSIENELLRELKLLDFDHACAQRFGELRGAQLKQGAVVNPVDMMIVSVALQHDLTVVTHNVRHFQAIPGLRVENWLES